LAAAWIDPSGSGFFAGNWMRFGEMPCRPRYFRTIS
jgi:hypothetical protein